MAKPRVRSANFTPYEVDLLLQLVNEKKIIKSKLSDAVTIKKKFSAWEEIVKDFNLQPPSGTIRTLKSLKQKYENIKNIERRLEADAKRYLLRSINRDGINTTLTENHTLFGISDAIQLHGMEDIDECDTLISADGSPNQITDNVFEEMVEKDENELPATDIAMESLLQELNDQTLNLRKRFSESNENIGQGTKLAKINAELTEDNVQAEIKNIMDEEQEEQIEILEEQQEMEMAEMYMLEIEILYTDLENRKGTSEIV